MTVHLEICFPEVKKSSDCCHPEFISGLVFRFKDAKRHRCGVCIECRKIIRYEGKLLTVTKPFLPLLGKDKRMGNDVISKNLYSKKKQQS